MPVMFIVKFLVIYFSLCFLAIAVAKKSEAFGKKEDFPNGFWEYLFASFLFMGPYCIIVLPFTCKKLLGRWGNIVELTILSVAFAIFLVWGVFLEYTLWTEDGIINRLRASTLSNSEVRGWIFSLNFFAVGMTCFCCGIFGARICWLLKSRERRTEITKRMWSLLPLWVLMGTFLCTMALAAYFPGSIVVPLVAVAGAILTGLTCMMSKSYQKG